MRLLGLTTSICLCILGVFVQLCIYHVHRDVGRNNTHMTKMQPVMSHVMTQPTTHQQTSLPQQAAVAGGGKGAGGEGVVVGEGGKGRGQRRVQSRGSRAGQGSVRERRRGKGTASMALRRPLLHRLPLPLPLLPLRWWKRWRRRG